MKEVTLKKYEPGDVVEHKLKDQGAPSLIILYFDEIAGQYYCAWWTGDQFRKDYFVAEEFK